MLGKRSRSVVGRLSELLSPRSPLDAFICDQSGNGHLVACADNGKKLNNCRRIVERGYGVGLAIVVALEKPSLSSRSRGGGGVGGMGFCSKYFVCCPGGDGRSNRDQSEEEEDYTCVTFHGPRESFTMVYHDQYESEVSKGGDGDGGHRDSPGLGFLSSCQLCGKKLHRQDIYMYRGEKGFCSAGCRSAQIMIEEGSEQCRSEASRATVANAWSDSAEAYSDGKIFPTSILAV